jgi:hypothetical protein
MNADQRKALQESIEHWRDNVEREARGEDLVTGYTPGFKGKITKISYIGLVVTADNDADATINMEIGTTNLTGGVITLSDANAAVKGGVVDGTAITGANSFSATDTISIEAAVTNAFTDGSGMLVITMEQTD